MSLFTETLLNTIKNATPENLKKSQAAAHLPETSQSQARLAICAAPCAFLFTPTMQCSVCGCPVIRKTKDPEETCPKGKW